MKRMTRRNFLGDSTKALAGSTALIAGFEVIGKKPTARKKQVSPSDKIHVALVGSGGMGKANLRSFLRIPEVECLAIADVDKEHLHQELSLLDPSHQILSL